MLISLMTLLNSGLYTRYASSTKTHKIIFTNANFDNKICISNENLVIFAKTTLIWKKTVTFLRDACLIFSLTNYVSKFSERETTKKHYFIDNGILHIFLNDDKTFLLENLCAIYLYQKYGNEQLFFYNKNIEVDFYIPEHHTAIQSCYSMRDIRTFEREVNALLKLHSFEHLDKAYIITYDEEKTIIKNDITIEIMPIWKWILQ